MTMGAVRAVMVAVVTIDPAAALAFRITAVTDAWRAELARCVGPTKSTDS